MSPSRSFTNLLLNFLGKIVLERGQYTTKVCVVLYKRFVKKTVPKYGGYADFSTTCLPTMSAYTHVYHCSLLKTGRKTAL